MRSLQHLVTASLFALSAFAQLSAQFDPEGAQVLSYFPQLADGGPANQKWVTVLTFVNPHFSLPASATVYLYDDNGAPLFLNFGNGAVSTFPFSVPPQGSVQFTSTGASSGTVVGWAMVASSLPLQGVVQFRVSVDGTPVQAVSSLQTPASHQFRSPVTPTTGVALANPYGLPVSIQISVLDGNGLGVANSSLSLPAYGHRAFDISQMFPSISGTFRGSIVLTGTAFTDAFVAWTLSGEAGVLSNYPPAALSWPVSQYERIWKAWQKIQAAAVYLTNQPGSILLLSTPPQLVIDGTTGSINSYAVPSQNAVHIFMNLAELISDSESELGFVIGHETGHIIQYQTGHLIFDQTNIESDADLIGVLLAIFAGYDPYGAAGALAKLSMASGTAGLVDQAFDNIEAQLGVDPHTSFNDRLALIFTDLQLACNLPAAQSSCIEYKSLIHPHLPPDAPLMVRPKPR